MYRYMYTGIGIVYRVPLLPALYMCIHRNSNAFSVLKVLEQLPESLAIAVLSALPVNLELQLKSLPGSLHRLAIEAASHSICRQGSLELDFDTFLSKTTTAEAVLDAVTTGTSGLQRVFLNHIPVEDNERLLQLISTACSSASDVSLVFVCSRRVYRSYSQPVAMLAEALSHNSLLKRLQLSVWDEPEVNSKLDCILGALTGLQSLSLEFDNGEFEPVFPAPSSIVTLRCLTHLSLGRGFHLKDLPDIVPHMTSLQSLCLKTCHCLHLTPLCPLTALQTLELQRFYRLAMLPPLPTCAALRSLKLTSVRELTELPHLGMLTALQTLTIEDCGALKELPPLGDLTSLQHLHLRGCQRLQEVPSLDSLTALQTLKLCHIWHVDVIPPLATVTALQTL
jgi:Leucine-rich repeat (LRR) protein